MIAFVFPGQGAQYSGMGKDLCLNFSSARDAFDEASEAVKIDMKKLCFEGSEADLKLTENTQPAILTTSIAGLRALRAETGASAGLMAGHSLGEITALVASGAIRFADGVRLVKARGRFMQEAVEPGRGAMAALLGIGREAAAEAVKSVNSGIVEVANVNSEEQIVIAGEKEAVEKAAAAAKEKGARRAVMLDVSAPFHCSLMKPAAEKFRASLAGVAISDLKVPVVTNLEGIPNSSGARVPELLEKQIFSPVLWLDIMKYMKEAGVSRYVEIGPGKVLSGLLKRSDRDAEVLNIEDTSGISSYQKISG